MTTSATKCGMCSFDIVVEDFAEYIMIDHRNLCTEHLEELRDYMLPSQDEQIKKNQQVVEILTTGEDRRTHRREYVFNRVCYELKRREFLGYTYRHV